MRTYSLLKLQAVGLKNQPNECRDIKKNNHFDALSNTEIQYNIDKYMKIQYRQVGIFIPLELIQITEAFGQMKKNKLVSSMHADYV